MKDYSAFYTARDTVSEILRKDFIGPVSKDETLTELPLQYYLMGKLYPKEDVSEELDMARNPFLENAAESYDSSISLSNQKNPSSMGITFTLTPSVTRFVVKGSYGDEEKAHQQVCQGNRQSCYRRNDGVGVGAENQQLDPVRLQCFR